MQLCAFPLATHLSQKLEERDVDPWTLQAAEISALLRILRLAREHITWIDPEQSLAGIKYGEDVLRLLMPGDGAVECAPGDQTGLRLRQLRASLFRDSGTEISESTLSRVLKALELSGFIRLFGATQNRRCIFLAKACSWLEGHRRDKRKISYRDGATLSVAATSIDLAWQSGEEQGGFFSDRKEKEVGVQSRSSFIKGVQAANA